MEEGCAAAGGGGSDDDDDDDDDDDGGGLGGTPRKRSRDLMVMMGRSVISLVGRVVWSEVRR